MRHYCSTCRRDVRADAQPRSHVLHLMLTVITFGVWAGPWMWLAMCPRTVCHECGSATYGGRWRHHLTNAACVVVLILCGLAGLALYITPR